MFDYILLADITNDTDASPRLAAGWKMSLSIKDCWQLSLPVDGYCQRSGHPSVKPFSTLEEGGLGELEKDGGDRGTYCSISTPLSSRGGDSALLQLVWERLGKVSVAPVSEVESDMLD
ncbi:hypothetical protein KUCAC02_023128 [Chaenocephalus aceratus]|uniref:Uncharacterized protein n=1 Tax=Chaenocephalus aceratus TaxID=36190 RepID=A0ACB9XP54_CHAAC|nr:hypothetical protein KUCAC02_023128 [Chaenocephalus aceratus]